MMATKAKTTAMSLTILSATRFKQLNRNRHATGAGLGVRKQMTAPVEPAGGEARALRFCISSGIVDRERDVVALNGWDLANFARNPVVLWGHDAGRLPIGRAFDVGVVGDRLMASVEFVPADIPEAGHFADAVFQLAQRGFLAATSVGFRPIKWDFTEDPERGADDWFPGIDFQAQELVEFSIVTVPANPDALLEPAQMPGEVAGDTPPASDDSLDHAGAIIAATKRRRLLAMLEMAGA